MATTTPDRRLLLKYKGDKCRACGDRVEELNETYGDVACLFEFNHEDPATKHPDYKNLMRRQLSAEQLDEVDKCVLLCNKCHRILHAQDRRIRIRLTVTIKDQYKEEQDLEGNAIVNLQTQTASFYTDQKIVVTPYVLGMKNKPARFVSWRDLNQGLLMSLLRNISADGDFAICDTRGRCLFKADIKEGDTCELKMDVSCDFVKGQLFTGAGETLFLQGGMALMRPDTIEEGGVVTLEFPLSELAGGH